jgi:hypothetical protein
MVSSPFFWPLPLLVFLCGLLLAGLPLFITWRGRRRPRLGARLRRTFCLLSLALLLWLLTLFLEVRSPLPLVQLGLGRANFAAMLFAATLALRFVQQVPLPATGERSSRAFWLWTETGLLVGLTLFTPWISAAERVEAGQAVTTYGPLFPAYLAHILGCLGAALLLSFQGWRRTGDQRVRGQLALIGLGMLATGSIASLTNAVLPYGWGDFRFCEVGTLSVLLFVLATAAATFRHGLFDLRVLLRRTLVYGLLLAFVLGTYRSAALLLSQYLTESAGKGVQFAVLLIAFSVDPLRRFLERKTERLLFGERGAAGARRKRRESGKGDRSGNQFTQPLLFP